MTDSPGDLLAAARAQFQARYGREPAWTALAPGRVNLIGDHTDYSGGLALPFAVDLYTVACAAPGEQGLRLSSASQPVAAELDLDRAAAPSGDWTDYVLGVVAGYRARGIRLPALDIHISGNLPLGAGLSSSAALELAVAVLLERVAGIELSSADRARLCQRAEQDFAGMPCGILDQFAIALAREGQLLRLDCGDQSVDWIPFPTELALLVIDSGVRHNLVDSAYGERRRQCEAAVQQLGRGLRDATPGDLERLDDPVIRSRARHVVTENRRVETFIDALSRADWRVAGAVMAESHASLAGDYEASCPEVDHLVEAAAEAGAIGARMTGGGFGGSVICLMHHDQCAAVAETVAGGYLESFGRSAIPRAVRPVAAPRVF